MRNIKLGEVCEVVKVHEKYNFTFEVQVIYDWAIEFIADNFDDYRRYSCNYYSDFEENIG